MRLAILLCVTVLAVAGSAQASPTTLTWHLVDGFQDGVLSTQPAPADLVAVNGIPFPGVPDCAGTGQVNDFGAMWQAVSSVSGAWYETSDDGTPTLFGSPGTAADIVLTGPASLHWVMTVEDDRGLGLPVATPVVLHVTVAAASPEWPSEPTALRALASGSTGNLVLAADATQGATHAMVGDHHVYEVDIPLALEADRLLAGVLDAYGRGSALVVQVEARYDLPCPQDTTRAAFVRAFSADGHRPSLTLETGPTISAPSVHPQFVNDDLVVHVSPNSAWGKYDLGNVTVTLTHPDGTTQPIQDATADARVHDHSPRDPRNGAGPIDRAFVVSIGGVAPGNYTLHVEARNLAGTETWTQQASFHIEPPKESPGPSPIVTLTLACAAALLARRR